MTDNSKACFYALATALLWSTIATAFKIALKYLDPWRLVFWSVATSTTLLTIIVMIQGKAGLVVSQFKQSSGLFLALGLLNPFLYHVALFGAYDLLPAQQAQALNYSWPMALTLLAVPLLCKKLSLTSLLCCLLAYGGVLLICTRGEFESLNFASPIGVILALSSTIIWALYWLLNTRREGDPVVGLLICFLCGLPWIIAATALFSDFWPIASEGLAAAAYVGLIEMGFAYILWLKALKLADNTAMVSNISYLSPFLSLIFIANILGESIYPATYAGLIMIIVAVLAQQHLSRK
ncbi:DMT family transporter [Endozoicomonas sp. GU-1]|uniref:DMT family transporter n=1 Tax=Endozoicomonas sp. GU-1 TaxID=3009078 RepID=UPI0022B30BE8|nr:DMT family transporter [Endozoicomonas sp. GU-1]WBA79937.1 DMT family transporter [Endozoicomonas sp. GU-1]WBA87513.1 DMT family transporter [Endozoicomonas sp. GU-1]